MNDNFVNKPLLEKLEIVTTATIRGRVLNDDEQEFYNSMDTEIPGFWDDIDSSI